MFQLVSIIFISIVWFIDGQTTTTPSPREPLPPPYIRTRDPLDDLYGLGFCIDVIGGGPRQIFNFDELWVHGCKPLDNPNPFLDQHFLYNDELNIIYGRINTPQVGRCLKEICPDDFCEFGLELIFNITQADLDEEDDDIDEEYAELFDVDDLYTKCAFIRYENDENQGELLYFPNGDSSSSSSSSEEVEGVKCLRVANVSEPTRGPQDSRTLYLQNCDDIEDVTLKTWDIIE